MRRLSATVFALVLLSHLGAAPASGAQDVATDAVDAPTSGTGDGPASGVGTPAATPASGGEASPTPPAPGEASPATAAAPSDDGEGEASRDAEDEEAAAPRDDEFGLRATVELGFLGVLAHELQLGSDGTRLDYPTDFGQSNLYFFARVQGDLDIWRQHILTFVYQPLDIETRASLPRDVRIDGLDLARGTPVRARYGFPFYRLGWAFDVLDAREHELAFGLGLQIRNATIEFATGDGEGFRARNDVGPVPLLRARGRFELGARWFAGFELDGFYAFIPGLNGTDNDVEGAIVDLSVRLGWRFLPHVDGFLNVRYLGGGAAGQGDGGPTNDGFQRNWLHFLTIALGVTLDSRS